MIPLGIYQLISLDLIPFLTALSVALSCALMGNYLVLRKMSLMGDAISHSVLPGIVIGFLFSGTRSSVAIFLGAAIAALVSILLIDLIRRLGRIEAGASMGVVFSIFFALGVLLIERAAASNVDLDADCVLHGQLETLYWNAPINWSALLSAPSLATLPLEFVSSAIFLALVLLVIYLFWKEFLIISFDTTLARSLGYPSRAIEALQMVMVALCVVVAFRAVGSILVIAMLLCPAACARLLTDRIKVHFALSAFFAAVAVIIGYPVAVFAPHWLGWGSSVNGAGTITVVLGGLIAVAMGFRFSSKSAIGKQNQQTDPETANS